MIDDSAGDRVGLLDVGEMGSIGDNYKLGAANSSSDLLGMLGRRRLIFGASDHEG